MCGIVVLLGLHLVSLLIFVAWLKRSYYRLINLIKEFKFCCEQDLLWPQNLWGWARNDLWMRSTLTTRNLTFSPGIRASDRNFLSMTVSRFLCISLKMTPSYVIPSLMLLFQNCCASQNNLRVRWVWQRGRSPKERKRPTERETEETGKDGRIIGA